jgi:hypothetical protein
MIQCDLWQKIDILRFLIIVSHRTSIAVIRAWLLSSSDTNRLSDLAKHPSITWSHKTLIHQWKYTIFSKVDTYSYISYRLSGVIISSFSDSKVSCFERQFLTWLMDGWFCKRNILKRFRSSLQPRIRRELVCELFVRPRFLVACLVCWGTITDWNRQPFSHCVF